MNRKTIGGLKGTKLENISQSYSSKTISGNIYMNDYNYSRILSIEDINEEREVWDIQVDCPTHSFIANNSIVHNSICTTQSVCAVGRPQATSVFKIGSYLQREGLKQQIPCIADGGIANSGHIIRALSVGADSVMMGSMFAGTDEAPGDSYYENGVRLKRYRGMGSLEAMKKRSAERYFGDSPSSTSYHQKPILIPQGVSGSVVAKGSIHNEIPRLVRAVKHGFQDLGYKTVHGLHQASLKDGEQRFQIRSGAAMREGGVHDLHSYSN
jgi:IMP dehydrogenase